MNTEEKLKAVIESFRVDIKKVAEDAICDVYSEMLPHVENDTFMNVGCRSQRVIENAIRGEFVRIDETTVSVKDDNNMDVKIKISDQQWDGMRTSLLKAMPACPKDLEIAQLKRQIEILEQF